MTVTFDLTITDEQRAKQVATQLLSNKLFETLAQGGHVEGDSLDATLERPDVIRTLIAIAMLTVGGQQLNVATAANFEVHE